MFLMSDTQINQTLPFIGIQYSHIATYLSFVDKLVTS